MKIRAYTGYNEGNKIHYYTEFEVVESLPEVGDIVYGSNYDGEKKVVTSIREVALDTCQGNDEVYNYDYFAVTVELQLLNDNDEWYTEEEDVQYFAIEKDAGNDD